MVGDQSGNTQTSFEFNATIVNLVGGGASLAGGRWELLGASLDYDNDQNVDPISILPTGLATIDSNVTDVMWSDRIVSNVGLDVTEPNTELWYNDAEVVFSGAARWLYFNTLRENRNLLEFRDHFHFHTVGDFANSGELNIDNGAELDVHGRFTNRGGTTIVSDASQLNFSNGLEVDGGLVRIEADADLGGINEAGVSIFLQPGTEWIVKDSFDSVNQNVVPGSLELVGRQVSTNFGDVMLIGEEASFDAIRSLANNSGSLVINSGNQLVITPQIGSVLQHSLGNSGRIEATAGAGLTVDASEGIQNGGGEVVVGSQSYLSASKVVYRDQTPGGTPVLRDGRFQVDGIAAVDLVSISPRTTLSGDGLIRGNVVGDMIQDTLVQNDGTVSPGNSVGSLEVMGDYVQSADAVLAIDVAGYLNGGGFDQLLVSGNATLDGLLDLTLTDGFGLYPGEQFTVLTAGHLIDDGLALAGSAADYFDMFVEAGDDGSVVLEFLGGDFPLTGDFNGNHIVDAADYTLWRNTLGQDVAAFDGADADGDGTITTNDYLAWTSHFGATLPGDFNADGTVDAADYTTWRDGLGNTYSQTDYDVWRSHFGQIAGSSSADGEFAGVPEPASWVLLILATAACSRQRIRVA